MRKLTGNNPYMSYTAQISQKQDEHNIYVIMKTMCPPGYLYILIYFLMHCFQALNTRSKKHCSIANCSFSFSLHILKCFNVS